MNKQRALVALVLHGWTSDNTGSTRTVMDALATVGIQSHAPDLPGHGTAAGDRDAIALAHYLDAVVAAYDMLAQRAATADQPARVLVVGTSFGGYLSALLTARRDVAALAMRVPANYPDEALDKHTPIGALLSSASPAQRHAWLAALTGANDTAALRAVAAFAGPLLIQEAELDEVIPSASVRAYVRAGDPGRVTHDLLVGAPHGLSTTPDCLRCANDNLLAWLAATAP